MSEKAKTPDLCNTGVSSSINQLETGGLDTLDVSLYGSWSPDWWDYFTEQLEAARKSAECGDDAEAFICSPDGEELLVEASGVRKGIYCRFVLSWQGCRIAIVNNREPSDKRLSVHVSIGSLRLMDVGGPYAWKSLMDLLVSFGYMHRSEVVGRADLCVDVPGIGMESVQHAVNDGRLICRARKSKMYLNSDYLETYVRGSGATLVRIYDKAREVRNDPIKQAMLANRRWGGFFDKAIRVEFQLRNKSLQRHFSIKSVDDLFANLGTISVWCTEKWLRIADKTVDRKNKNQAHTDLSGLWVEVCEKFADWCNAPLDRVPEDKSGIMPNLEKLAQQAVGCVTTICAHLEWSEFKELWQKIGQESERTIIEPLKVKRAKLRSAARVIFAPDVLPSCSIEPESIPF